MVQYLHFRILKLPWILLLSRNQLNLKLDPCWSTIPRKCFLRQQTASEEYCTLVGDGKTQSFGLGYFMSLEYFFFVRPTHSTTVRWLFGFIPFHPHCSSCLRFNPQCWYVLMVNFHAIGSLPWNSELFLGPTAHLRPRWNNKKVLALSLRSSIPKDTHNVYWTSLLCTMLSLSKHYYYGDTSLTMWYGFTPKAWLSLWLCARRRNSGTNCASQCWSAKLEGSTAQRRGQFGV